jgi:ubiquitin C-terminal hydrolase
MSTHFGLRNQRGSCWINAALQGVFRIPDLQQRFKDDECDSENVVEMCLEEIWGSRGDEGLKDFYGCVKTKTMPAGEDIGDSHELLEFLCDRVPFLDKLMRFKVAHSIKCVHCDYSDTRTDTVTEFDITPSKPKQTLKSAIEEAVTPQQIPDWKCEKCKQKGCQKQLLLGNFPKVLVFHMKSMQTTTTYSAELILNKQKYALFGIICFNGGHWYTFGRDLPPGQPWHQYNDNHVQSYDPKHFPLIDTMRLLMYYRINE